jgi:predicted DCC family thiol-disulfide oxidoreductase YuxK
MKENEPNVLLLFDGECNFCRASVDWLIRHDPVGRLRYAPLQSFVAREILDSRGINPNCVSSVVLLVDSKSYYKSEAIFEALSRASETPRIIGHLRQIPLPIRDFVYDLVANHRPFVSRIIGTKNQNYEPNTQTRERFLAT